MPHICSNKFPRLFILAEHDERLTEHRVPRAIPGPALLRPSLQSNDARRPHATVQPQLVSNRRGIMTASRTAWRQRWGLGDGSSRRSKVGLDGGKRNDGTFVVDSGTSHRQLSRRYTGHVPVSSRLSTVRYLNFDITSRKREFIGFMKSF